MTSPNQSQRNRMAGLFDDAVGASDPTKRMDSPVVNELNAGQIIGKCRIERVLGRGGMGAVYLARHATLDVPVAVKVLPPHISRQNPDYAERFLREARIAARLRHPNVMAVMDADQDPETGLYYIVLEYLDGGSIRSRLSKGPLPETAALQVINAVAKALTAAESHGIVHRDIKPDNILLSKDGRVKLADLGLAKQMDGKDGNLTQSSSAVGTPYYMSPEQIRDSRHVDVRSDIYSLGATFFHLMTGQPPFPGDNVYGVLHKVINDPVPDPRSRKPDLSESAARICMKMMEKDLAHRYQTPTELLSDIAKKASPAAAPIELAPEPGLARSGDSNRGGQPTPPVLVPSQGPVDLSPRPRPVNDARGFNPMWIVAACAVLVLGIAIRLLMKSDAPVKEAPRTAKEEKAKETEKPVENAAAKIDESPREAPKESEKVEPKETEAPKPPPEEKKPVEDVSVPAKRVAVTAADLAKGAVLVLTFEEATRAKEAGKDTLRDLSASVLGELKGNPALVDAPLGKAMSFDGTDVVELPALEERSVAMWVKPTMPFRMSWYDGGGADALAAFQVGMFVEKSYAGFERRGVYVALGDLDVLVPVADISGAWHHVAVVWDGAESLRVAVDGKYPEGYLVAGGVVNATPSGQPFRLPAAPSPAVQPTFLGRARFGTEDLYRGQIDDLAVWDRRLSEEEVAALAEFKGSACEAIGEVFEAERQRLAKIEADEAIKAAELKAEEERKAKELAAAAEKKPVKDPEKDPKDDPDQPPVKIGEMKGKKLKLDFAKDCAAAFKFDESFVRGQAKFTKDFSGNGRDAEMHWSASLDDKGKEGKALLLNGDKDFLSFPSIATQAVALWVRIDGEGSFCFYDGSCGDGRSQGFIVGVFEPGAWPHMKAETSGFLFGAMREDLLLPTKNLRRTWHHLVVSVKGNQVHFMVDGTFPMGIAVDTEERSDKQKQSPQSPLRLWNKLQCGATRGPVAVGSSQGTLFARRLHGAIDELAVWERALTLEEMAELWSMASSDQTYVDAIRHVNKVPK